MTHSSELLPLVAVVVPAYRDNLRLKRCLGALALQSYPAERLVVCVVDNAGDPDTEAIVRRYHFRYLYEATPGSYAARNCGIRSAESDIVAFTDSDCVPAREWITSLVQVLRSAGREAVVAGAIEVFPRGVSPRGIAETFDCYFAFDQQKEVERKQRAMTANLAASRAVFDRVGLFDQSLKSGGDGEWTARAVARGIPLFYSEEAVVGHPARSSIGDHVRKLRRTTGGQAAIYRKSPEAFASFRPHNQLRQLRPGLRGQVQVALAATTRCRRCRARTVVQLVTMALLRRYVKLYFSIYYKLRSSSEAPRM